MALSYDVTVIGAGITGSVAACLLHDRGLRILLIDRHGEPMRAASRWNEGKLHIGYTYTGTESLDTARLMLEGTAHFERILRAVCGRGIDEKWWSQPVVYLVDPVSIFSVDELWARAQRVAELLRAKAAGVDGLCRFTEPPLERLTSEEARILTGQQRIAAAWRTGERAVSPRPVAELVADAVRRRDIEVIAAEAEAISRINEAWSVRCEDGRTLVSRAIINASWESRARLDRPVVPTPRPVSIRYKVALFGSVRNGLGLLWPSTRILGAYGDVTPYGDGNIYLSWYPAGLLASSDAGNAPPIPEQFDRAKLTSATLSGLGLEIDPGTDWTIAGGYVVAEGKGVITDRRSSLHERHRPDARLLAPRYVTVDTGKYTLGPLLAERAADSLLSSWNSQ